MTNVTKIALSAVTIALLSGCGDTTVNQTPSNVAIDASVTDSYNATTSPTDPIDPGVTGCPKPTLTKTLSGDLTIDTDLTSDTLWLLNGLVAVKGGATLTIAPCTTIAGMSGTGDATSYMIIDKDSQIIADGTEEEPIIFTSAEVALNGGDPAPGQWGGLTIIGHAANSQVNPYEVNTAYVADDLDMTDSSGVLKHVKILNSGIMMEQDKEINGLSLVGVGSETTIANITVDLSDDDCIEAWGGTVNMTDITISNCTDDHFDIDDGYSGTVTNLKITQGTSQFNLEPGNAAIEMSGTTAAWFDGLTIVQDASAKEGVVYFKGAGIGGHFKNATITDNVTSTTLAGAIHSNDVVAIDTVSFENVTLNGISTEYITGVSAPALIEKFNSGTNNTPDL